MEELPNDVILEFPPDTLTAVRKIHGLHNIQDLNNAIDILDAWIKQQNHFTKKNFDREYLERLIISCKGSVEKVKGRLDKLCTLRGLMPHYFGDYDVRKDLANIKGVLTYVSLPKMGNNYERMLFIKCSGKVFSDDIFLNAYRNLAMLVEYSKQHDYADSYMFLVDMRETHMTELVTKLGLVEMRQIITVVMDGYGLRLKGVHFLTNSKVIETLMSLMKQFLSAKIGGRLKAHRTLESFYEVVPKEILPKEYGGNEISLEELHEKWVDTLSSEEYKRKWREVNEAKTDETLRQVDTFNEQYMGMPGTFRALTVD